MAVNPTTQVALNDGNPFVNEEELIQDWLAYTEGDAKEEIIRKYVKESGKTFDWLESNFDFHFGERCLLSTIQVMAVMDNLYR